MRLTRAADYGVRVMLHLANLPRGVRASRAQLAKSAAASPDFVAKILQKLAKARLVRSRTGRSGGFDLAKAADQISILDILVAIDGPLSLNRCLTPTRSCHRVTWCPAHPVWLEAQASLRLALGGASLEWLTAQAAAKSVGKIIAVQTPETQKIPAAVATPA